MKIKCSMCEGSGKYWVSPTDDCRNCNGSGNVDLTDPTQEGSEFWIQADGKSYRSCAETANGGSGKWLLFVNKSDVDNIWQRIRQETVDEKLGSSSKVSTKRGWIHHGMPQDYVICVHTPNCKDKEDVDRVRTRLRELGFTSKLGYKTDMATINGTEELIYKE